MKLKDPKHPMIPGTSLKMCPVASVDVFLQLMDSVNVFLVFFLDLLNIYNLMKLMNYYNSFHVSILCQQR